MLGQIRELLFVVVAALAVAACGPGRGNLWKKVDPQPFDRELVASEIEQDAQLPLLGLPFRDTLTLQCLKDGAIRLVLSDLSAPVPTTTDPQLVWQPPPVRDMTYVIDWGPTQAITFTREYFDRGLGGGLSYRYVANERVEPRLVPALQAMSRGRSMRRFDMARKPKYALSPKIGAFIQVCHGERRADAEHQTG